MSATAKIIGRVLEIKKKYYEEDKFKIMLNVISEFTYKNKEDSRKMTHFYHFVYFYDDLALFAEKEIDINDTLEIEGDIHNKKVSDGALAGRFIYNIVCKHVKILEKA